MPREQSEDGTGTDDAGVASSWPDLRYGNLEDLLVELSGGDKRSVAGRFRNLRQMPFPDAIRTGTGNRVEYDLPRVLALSAVFEVNALLVPQAHAVAVVQGVWPELVRGFIAAAVGMGILQKPGSMPSGLSATVSILPDGFSSAVPPTMTASNIAGGPARIEAQEAADLRVDCAGLMARLAPAIERSSGRPGAARAFGDLDRTFGWSVGSVPHRAAAAELVAGSSFLDRGPYLERADAFLRICEALPDRDDDDVPVRRRDRQAAQNLLDYLCRPSPIDAWKAEIGTDEGRPRLKHLLTAVGVAAGLKPIVLFPSTLHSTAGADPERQAQVMVKEALRLEDEHRRAVAAVDPSAA